MINVILTIIGLIIAMIGLIVSIIVGFKHKKIKKIWNYHFRKCINCGYSRDDIADEWEIFAPDDTQIRCQKCKTVQKRWKKK